MCSVKDHLKPIVGATVYLKDLGWVGEIRRCVLQGKSHTAQIWVCDRYIYRDISNAIWDNDKGCWVL